MSVFLSTYRNKLDKKGRVSVPATFRSIICSDANGFHGIVVYKSVINECLEACNMARMEKISQSIDNLDPLSEERDAFASTILAESLPLAFDPEGRVVLPKDLAEILSLGEGAEEVCFVGKGQIFEIWNPAKLEEHKERARKIAKECRGSLKIAAN